MQPSLFQRNISQSYLSLVPVLVAAVGFGIGHISYKIYLPIWIINVFLMVMAAWVLGGRAAGKQDIEKKHVAFIGFFLVGPWVLVSLFFGLGPPPATAAGWVATAAEQEVRYSFLIISGVMVATGFSVLKDKLKRTDGNFYSRLGFIAIMVAVPLFVINMSFWGSFLVESFRIFVSSGSTKMPDWFLPVSKQFELIAEVEVALTYLATAAFAASLKFAGWFSKTACHIYIAISFAGFLILIISPFSPEPLATAGYFVSIPAIPFVMPYLMGINLLRRAGS